jgi:hypothetical protein
LVDRRVSLPLIAVVFAANVLFFLGGGLAGRALERKVRQTPPPQASPLPRSVAEPSASKEWENTRHRLESEIRGLKSELSALGHELARLEGRVEAKPATIPPPTDLNLPDALRSLNERVEGVDGRLQELRAELGALPKQVDSAAARLRDDLSAELKRAKPGAADGALAVGATLFREGKFAPAREVFLALTRDKPADARFWYYAALSTGFATGDWAGETERLVRRGLEYERAGTPTRAEIDAQFAQLGTEQGKPWLNHWRARVSTR